MDYNYSDPTIQLLPLYPQHPTTTSSSTHSSLSPPHHQQPDLEPTHHHQDDEEDDHHSTGGFNPNKKRRPNKARPPPPAGMILTEKSCRTCRVRKVRCDRLFPVCGNCKARGEECDLISLHPKDKQSRSERDKADSARIERLEQRLAELESTLAEDTPSDPTFSTTTTSTSHLPSASSIGPSSVDWRLATPQMAISLSQSLCNAFYQSCCFILPSFSFYRSQLSQYQDISNLPPAAKVAITAFCAIGARASPHSAVLGIETNLDKDVLEHPEAPLVSAGARRQSACQSLVSQAHSSGFETGLLDEANVESLAALLALIQMSNFTELLPKRSATLHRIALSHYKELQDTAAKPSDITTVQTAFGLALFSNDALIAAYSRRTPLITETDFTTHFSQAGIVFPSFPNSDLVPLLKQLLPSPNVVGVEPKRNHLKAAIHLATCFTAACQRLFAKLAAPPFKGLEVLREGIQTLFKAIDQTRSAIQHIQSIIYTSPTLSQPHSHSHSHGSDETSNSSAHEEDFLALIVRVDRDLLDLYPMCWTLLKGLRSPGLPDWEKLAEGRVRRGLKAYAAYAKFYLGGADQHMSFHLCFQLEHNPTWPQMALQRLGATPGPTSVEEELTPVEIGWLTEALQHACFYTPAAERRLAELSPRFQQVDTTPLSPSLPLPIMQPLMSNNGAPFGISNTPTNYAQTYEKSLTPDSIFNEFSPSNQQNIGGWNDSPEPVGGGGDVGWP